MRDTCLVIDGNSLLYRAFHALPLMDVNGVYTNAVHGFLMMFLKVLEEEKPRYAMAAFDEHGPTFRHNVYPEYKAGRKAMPEEMKGQFDIIKEILRAMGIGVFSVQGYEADDILGTVGRICGEKDMRALLLTGDRDALQLASESTQIMFTRKGISETILFDPATVREIYGITPEQVTDWKGLMGDSSDNIPGIPGVGEKTAVKLLQQYGTLENVLADAENISGKLGERIRENRELAVFSKDLATIRPTAPIELDFSKITTDHIIDGLAALKKYHLNGIATRVAKLSADAAPSAEDAAQEQQIPAPDWQELSSAEEIGQFISSAGKPLYVYVAESDMTLAGRNSRGRVMLSRDLLSAGLYPEDALQCLSKTEKLITHDGKKLLHTLRDAGLPLPEITFDTMLAAYLLSPQEKSYALHTLGDEDAWGVRLAHEKQSRLLKENGMDKLMYEVEMPLLRTLFNMETEGFRVDTGVLKELGREFDSETEQLKEEIYRLTGQRFNLNSPQQLGKVLFEDLGLKSGKKTSRGYSTDVDTLEKLADEHPCIPLILRYRQLAKLNGTYIDPLIRKQDKDGRVRTSFDQTGTATGRISSSEPNLQNIPVRTPQGREIRKAFIAKEGCVLVDADYSQIELRVLAHMSGDAAMTDAFVKGQDIHSRTASEVYGVPLDEVTKEMRSASKAVNFGLVYGISEFGLARNIGISRREAADFIARYFSRYPGIKKYMDESVRLGYERQYSVTMLGRRRYLNELKAPNANIRAFGERAAMNTPVQGTAADIIKLAMVRVDNALKAGGFGARLILQVHDELIIECPREEEQAVSELLRREMEQVVQMNVPLLAEVRTGESWYETK
ncbi:MAG: DNA polymerase I [Clostridiales bacterium]|nr:DNA polymerase I [Clostridiales bacterium]